MKLRIYLAIWSLFTLAACSTSTKVLSGHTYSYHSKNRTLKLIFKNDTICEVQNRFYCKDIDPKYQLITFCCKYQRKSDTADVISDVVYLENIDKNVDKDSLIFYIPPQKSDACDFLKIEARVRKPRTWIGPEYSLPYELYGFVPNITSEKLYIMKNKIVLLKNVGERKIGFIFK